MPQVIQALSPAEGSETPIASGGSRLCEWNAGGLQWNADRWSKVAGPNRATVSGMMKSYDKVPRCENGAASGSRFCVDHACVICVTEGRVRSNKCVKCQGELSIFDEDNG